VVWAADLADPFALHVVGGGGLAPGLRFPGQYYQPETGLYYNYFRDYDPSTGRYIQSDPIGLEGGLNTYLYAKANPLRYTDPTGENPAAGAIWGGNIGTGIGAFGGPVGAAIGRVVGAGLGAGIGYGIAKMCEGDDDDPSCDEHFTRCLDSSLADRPGSVYGSSRCGVCRDQCVRNGGTWPDIAITGSGSVRCDYWNFQ